MKGAAWLPGVQGWSTAIYMVGTVHIQTPQSMSVRVSVGGEGIAWHYCYCCNTASSMTVARHACLAYMPPGTLFGPCRTRSKDSSCACVFWCTGLFNTSFMLPTNAGDRDRLDVVAAH